ncbi:MAG: transposase, partial [Treponema sp.]|nr:transposase [Treponema sp.]
MLCKFVTISFNISAAQNGGIIICDFWGAYRTFKRISSCLLQFCWAHLIREIRFLAESPDKGVRRYGRRVLKVIRLMFQT